MQRSLIHQTLVEAAARYPQRTAVESGAGRLSYRQLGLRSSRLAAVLQAQGVASGDRVALHLDKSIGAVVGIFGILKSGAAYVPIDTRAPPARTAIILADCGVRVLLGSRSKFARIGECLPRDAVPTLVGLDPETGNTQDVPDRPDHPAALRCLPRRPPSEQDLAYILYTSGSTGTPKGVMISHRAALSFTGWASDTFPLRPDDRVISQASFHFDLSVFDLFVTLQAGATLVLPPPGIGISPAAYAEFLNEERISLFYATPAILNSLLRHGRLDRYAWHSLRLLLFAGDVMPPGLLRELMAKIPGARYCNLYGPTETNVCTWFEVSYPPAGDDPIPIGQACTGLELKVVDADGRLNGGDQPGELWVRGANLMSGYWNRPGQTAERLIADSGRPNAPWYRTGDWVKLAADGNLLFFGRIDNMIKTRGYRVEPEEIERLLLQHHQINEVAVVPVRDASAGVLLKAVVAASEPPPAVRALQRLCAQHLPDYMIPRFIEFVAELPKTSTGKLDRKRVITELAPD